MSFAAEPGGSSVASLSGVWKSYGNLSVLRDVSLELRRGEVHMLLGENGAGKSTLVGLLIGAHAADRGVVALHGRPIAGLRPFEARQLGINAVLQDFSLAPALTVVENYFLGRETTSRGVLRKAEMRRVAREAIARLGIRLDVDAKVADLSRPEQQLLEIVRALNGRPGALILDEPTAALSHEESALLFGIVRNLRADGWAILYITHRLEEVRQIGDCITVLRDGSVTAHYRTASIDDDTLIRDMVGRPLSTLYPAIAPRPGAEALALVGVADQHGQVVHADITLRYGEIVGVGGLVGCGKDMLGKLIFGLAGIGRGHIALDGEPCVIAGPRDALRRGIVYLPQDRRGDALALNRSAAENMTLEFIREPGGGAALGFLRQAAIAGFVKSMLAMLDVRPRDGGKAAQEFSGGNQQKLVLARALSKRRKICIFAEPTAGIDVGARLDFYHQLEKLCDGGAAIMLITSALQELVRLSHRIYVMHAGRTVAELEGSACTEEAVTRHAFGGERAHDRAGQVPSWRH